MGNCHMGTCSWSKPISVRAVQQSKEQAILEITLLGGESADEGKRPTIRWNKEPHKIVITCSYNHPSVSMDGQVDELPLNANGVPDVLISATNLYFQYCHSYNNGQYDGIKKFGYNVENNNP